MAHLTYPFTITPNTLASASQVMGNFDAIKAIINGGIDSTNLADKAVTAGKLADKAVNTSALADEAVSGAKLAAGAVTTAKLADAAVTSTKLADGSVTSAKLADGSVTSSKLANGGVTEAKLASQAVTNTKLGNNAVSTDKIQDGAVTNAKLASATSSKTANTIAMRDSNGRLRVNTPSHNDDAANKGYVDGKVAGLPSAIYWGRVAYGGISAVAPPGWTVSTQGVGRVRVTHNLGTTAYGVALTPLSFAHAHVSTINANYFEVTTLTISITGSGDLLGTSDYAAFYYTVIVT